MKNIIKKTIIFFFGNLTCFFLFFLNKFSKYEYFYPPFISFGDTYIFYLENYLKIKKNKNKKALIFGGTDAKIIKLLFEKKKYLINPFYIFDFLPDHEIHNKIRNSKYFTPKINTKHLNNRDSIKNLISYNFEKKKIISKNLFNLKKNKYFLMLIKNYNKNSNDITGASPRQTVNLEKVFSLIEFLSEKNYQILIIGKNNDKSVNLIKKYYDKKKNSNLFFFKDLTKNYSIFDQLYVIKNSVGYVGSGCGFNEPVFFQKKKAIIFDMQFELGRFPISHLEHKITLYKKIFYQKKTQVLNCDITDKIEKKLIKEYTVIETPLQDIKNEIIKTFNI